MTRSPLPTPGERRQPGRMTAAESGRLGGIVTAATHGNAYMRRIALRGGAAGGRPRLRTLAEIEAETHRPKKRSKGAGHVT